MRAAIFSLCLGLSAVAHASSAPSGVDGVPVNVDLWAPGVFSVTSTVKAELRRNADPPVEFFEGRAPGTFLSPLGCFAVVAPNGSLSSVQNCLASGNISPDNPNISTRAVQRVRFTPSGTGYAMVRLDTATLELLYAPLAEVGDPPWDWLTISNPVYTPTTVMGVTETASGTQALFHVRSGASEFLWYQGRDEMAEVSISDALTTVPPATVDLIAADGPHPIALFGNSDGLFRGQLVPPPVVPGSISPPFSRVTVLDGGTPLGITSVDVNTGTGSVRGEGFGLAVGTGAGGIPVVLGAVPTDSASDAGTLWRVHPEFAASPLPVRAVEVGCVGSAFCVITLDSPGDSSDNLILYTNAASPRFLTGTQARPINEGSGPVAVQVTATDDDGDAVRVSVDALAAADLLDVSAAAQPDTLDLVISPRGEVCKDETRVLNLWASDGLGAHDQGAGLSVTIVNQQGPQAPGVTPTAASTPAAGPPRVFTATPPPAGACATVGYRWDGGAGQPALATAPDGTATFTPPDFVCSRAGTVYTYTVQGLDEGGLASPPTSFAVTVTAWGRPSSPFDPDAERALASGPDAGVEVAPDALLPCAPGTPDLPPVETVWRLTAPGEGVPPGLTVKDSDGGTVSLASEVVSGALRVEAAACARATLSLTARNRINSIEGGLQEGTEAQVRVVAEPPEEDATTAGLNLTAVPAADQQVDVNLGTSLLCPGEYALRARMALSEGTGGPELASEVVSVPGSWSPPVPETCDATEYLVQGALLDDSGQPRSNGGTAEARVTVPARDVRLGALEGGALVARCGEGVTGTLTQAIPAGACRTAALLWTQVDGPALTEDALSGESVTPRTQETGLEGLVGESITLRVTAEAAGGRTATTEHVVPITTEPFVDLTHETESPTGSENGLVGVVVRLRNTTECPVSGLRHVEQVQGLEWLPGSVKVDGQPMAEEAREDGFAVEGIPLPASGTAVLTYVARPRLLTSPHFGGEVLLNGVPVSAPLPEEQATSGCGCSGAGTGSGAAVFGLLALARLLRRRRDGAAG
ncbi:MYXO-CTERM sorting domain-containing protein [Pyxidicoccus trucidator]|uniref:MYXO-CTERM sorting domain-containing protein n=1 Tax=Pyxidicoccus trucidator TaxID=2709662 RepID=UPI0013DD81C7|nr:MYXO-CTERM sorting domain-containing protein [Pyxidicoccus trucidator]